MEKLPKNAYGKQLLFDGYAADAQSCADVSKLYNFLMKLPDRIGMRRVGFPQIIQITEAGIKGLSGFVFIMESHISIHTYEERGFVTADVYSCKTFDEKTLITHLVSAFGIQAFETQSIIRGRQFDHTPTHILSTKTVAQK